MQRPHDPRPGQQEWSWSTVAGPVNGTRQMAQALPCSSSSWWYCALVRWCRRSVTLKARSGWLAYQRRLYAERFSRFLSCHSAKRNDEQGRQ